MDTIQPGKATFLFTVGTGLASGIGNYLSSNLSDKYGGLTKKELTIGIVITVFGVAMAYGVMNDMLKARAGAT